MIFAFNLMVARSYSLQFPRFTACKRYRGISDADFLKTVAATETSFLCKTPGFVRRTLSKSEDGTWFDYVEWATMKEATNAMERSMADAGASAFVQSIAPESIAVQHWQLLSETK